jgi:glycine betaine catabolism A
MYDSRKVLDVLSGSPAGFTLPQPFYNDPEIFEFDLAEVWGRSWVLVGFEAELPEAGSYLATTIGRSSVLIVRGRDGVVRGFHNACRHRGSQLCEEGHGKSAKLICPYHKWTYDLEGRLIGAARMPAEFKMADHGLLPVPVETAAGCVYVALTQAAPDFAPFRAALESRLGVYRLKDAKVAFHSTLTEKANWKLVMENARECYHCATSHPELKLAYPISYGAAVAKDRLDYNQRLAQRVERLGLSTAEACGNWWHVERYPLNPGMESISMDGKAVVNRRLIAVDEREIGGLWWAMQPHSFCHALSDYAFMFSAIPVGPQETRVESKWLVHKDAVEGVDYTIESLTETWTKTNLQDRELAERNQRGVNGIGYLPGPYSLDEDFVIRFGDWYRAMVASAAEAREPRAPKRALPQSVR